MRTLAVLLLPVSAERVRPASGSRAPARAQGPATPGRPVPSAPRSGAPPLCPWPHSPWGPCPPGALLRAVSGDCGVHWSGGRPGPLPVTLAAPPAAVWGGGSGTRFRRACVLPAQRAAFASACSVFGCHENERPLQLVPSREGCPCGAMVMLAVRFSERSPTCKQHLNGISFLVPF